MNSSFHSCANYLAAHFLKLLFGYSTRIHVVDGDKVPRSGRLLLASNHISHFDPFIISSVVRRKIDWMAMAEFFPNLLLGAFLRAVDAFPADRDRADRKTIRTALERLQLGRIVGIFPEGGIRDGVRSLLEGAPLRPGAATLAHMGAAPILPCVIVGSDRLYGLRNWLPLRRVPIWIAFGNPISGSANADKHAARKTIEQELAASFKSLYAEIREKFRLTTDDLPHPPRERMKSSRPALLAAPKLYEGGSGRSTGITQNKGSERRGYSAFDRARASALDFGMCASMNILQSRHRLPPESRDEMERYVGECEEMTAHMYYAAPTNGDLAGKLDRGAVPTISWQSPIKTKFPANNIARVDMFPCSRGWEAPTVLMLHALMSATRIGYRRLAARFNELGWNACFVHLPYHYSRVPRGYWNGELAITADLVRNAEGLRQGVIEIRQLLTELRARGGKEFGILGTSYGGWIGALLAMVERDFSFVALMGPIVNVEHAIWQNPATAFMRRELRRRNVEPEMVARHFHLSSPLHNQPMCDPRKILFVAGDYDVIARASDIEEIHRKWRGSELLRVAQGHFGYRMLRETVAQLRANGAL